MLVPPSHYTKTDIGGIDSCLKGGSVSLMTQDHPTHSNNHMRQYTLNATKVCVLCIAYVSSAKNALIEALEIHL